MSTVYISVKHIFNSFNSLTGYDQRRNVTAKRNRHSDDVISPSFQYDSQCRTMPDLYLFLEWEAACISIEPGGSLLCSNIHISQRIRTCHHL